MITRRGKMRICAVLPYNALCPRQPWPPGAEQSIIANWCSRLILPTGTAIPIRQQADTGLILLPCRSLKLLTDFICHSRSA